MAAALCIATGQEGHAVFEISRELKPLGRMEHAATAQWRNRLCGLCPYTRCRGNRNQRLSPTCYGAVDCNYRSRWRQGPKRPLMGAAAAQSADYVVVTDDNPRSEDPKHIRNMVLEGTRVQDHVIEIGDRAEAILRAIDMLETGDGLLITGKGHETGQIIGDDVLPFNDEKAVAVGRRSCVTVDFDAREADLAKSSSTAGSVVSQSIRNIEKGTCLLLAEPMARILPGVRKGRRLHGAVSSG